MINHIKYLIWGYIKFLQELRDPMEMQCDYGLPYKSYGPCVLLFLALHIGLTLVSFLIIWFNIVIHFVVTYIVVFHLFRWYKGEHDTYDAATKHYMSKLSGSLDSLEKKLRPEGEEE